MKKRIEEESNTEMLRYYNDDEYPCDIKDIQSAFTEAFKRGAEYALSHQWISVKEALPNNYDYVLAGYKDSVFMAWCRRQYDEWHDIYGFELNVDRWMPIPKFEQGGIYVERVRVKRTGTGDVQDIYIDYEERDIKANSPK